MIYRVTHKNAGNQTIDALTAVFPILDITHYDSTRKQPKKSGKKQRI